MALDRTWFNTLIDDAGDNESGTVIAMDDFDALMDDIDAEIARLETVIDAQSGAPAEQTTTSTGTVNDLSLTSAFTYLRCNNASALVLTGFSVGGSAPTEGARVIIDNVGSSTVKVSHQTGSTAGHRLICASTAGQIVGAGGRMIAVYDSATGRWRVALLEPGAWIEYSATSTVTGWSSTTIKSIFYSQQGRRVFVVFRIAGTSNATTISFTLPLACINAGSTEFGGPMLEAVDNGAALAGASKVQMTSGSSTVQAFSNMAGAAWTAANAKNIIGNIWYETP